MSRFFFLINSHILPFKLHIREIYYLNIHYILAIKMINKFLPLGDGAPLPLPSFVLLMEY